jgi:uncharacterized membrane protein YdjX (TVP38/TMEM64 family)
MKEALLQAFNEHPQAAFLLSIAINIVIALLGVVPSVFITAANLIFFGFWKGVLISFIGEAVGALIAFLLYRKGFKKQVSAGLQRFPKAQELIEARGKKAFMLILGLRLLPFVPSGIVTFAASVGRVSAMEFFLASSLGKVPALMIEAYSVYQVTQFNWQGKLILGIAAVALVWWALKNKQKKG